MSELLTSNLDLAREYLRSVNTPFPLGAQHIVKGFARWLDERRSSVETNGVDPALSAAGRHAAESSAPSGGIPSEDSEPATVGAGSLVLRACTAYEQGFGQFGRALENPYTAGTPESEAWNIGWQVAKQRAVETPAEPKVGDEVTITIPLSEGFGGRYPPHDGWKISRIDRTTYVFLSHPNGSEISLFPGQFALKSTVPLTTDPGRIDAEQFREGS